MNNFLNFCNIILKIFTMSIFSFYTSWALILFVLYALGILTQYQSSIFVILLNVLFAGMVMTYVYPKEIEVPFIKRKIGNNLLKIYNLIFHVLPFIIFVYMYNPKIKQDNLYIAFFSLLIYVLMFNPLEVYNYKKKSNLKIFTNCLVVFYIIILGILIITQKNLF
jgi:hypothetical protein